MLKRIGLLGGTFHPIHNAHIQIALAAYEQYSLDAVWFLPTGIPPHKNISEEVTPQERLDMVSLAIKNYPQFQVCDVEIAKSKPCYTWETLKQLNECYENEMQFYFIIGGDSFFNFEKWKKPDLICQYADILVAKRPAQKEDEDFLKQLLYYQKRYGNHFFEIDVEPMDLSSTKIRKKLLAGYLLQEELPEEVFVYIKEHGLYQNSYSWKYLEEIENKLRQTLNTSRFQHTIGVMYTAGNLAGYYEYPMGEALVAGLLHDCAKCMKDEERISICHKHNIFVSLMEERQPHLLHAKVGAYLAKSEYGIEDERVLHAIKVHTTGCVNMSQLDKILFVADYMEPHRSKAAGLPAIRKMAYQDLDECVYMILRDMLLYLEKTPQDIDETTRDAYEYYKKIHEQRKISKMER